jgi:valine--pyruvate aminotransferase
MEDLGRAMAGNSEMLMLGGGNPAHIPEVQKLFRRGMDRIMGTPGEFERFVGNYDSPQGNTRFIESLAGLLRREYGWDVGPRNIALTNGSQTAFFVLFNMFAGPDNRGRRRKILFPLAPEYVGYADLGIEADSFVSRRPLIRELEAPFFKYHIDFDALKLDDEIGALCLSRPTNPTGNVLDDAEVARLARMAADAGVPFILDAAYGGPFPEIIFSDAKPYFDSNTIFCLSLSKLGLPAARTGIVVANEEVIRFLSGMNAVMGLAPSGVGAGLVQDLIDSGEILSLSREVIRPWYRERAERAVELLRKNLDGVDYRIHKPEGALFLWLWFPGLRVGCRDLYERLKRRGVLVVPGSFFFPGLEDDPWPHKDECIRVTYSQDEEVVRRGIEIIGDELRRARSGE